MDSGAHMVVIGGRSGVGKSSVAAEMHHQLAQNQVQHAVIEGDALDLAWPAPWQHGLAERNLAAIWSNYRELGYRRLVYTNTVSVLEADHLAAAMGDQPIVTAVLLTGSDDIIANRLATREVGTALQDHLQRSAARAQQLEQNSGSDVIRIDTTHLSVAEIATEIIAKAGWIAAKEDENNDRSSS